MYHAIHSPLTKALDLLFPLSCLGCAQEGAWLCAQCENGIPTILAKHCPFCEAKTSFGNTCDKCKPRHSLDGAISCIPYANPLVQSLVQVWKYNGVAEITPYLARFVERSLFVAHRSSIAATRQTLVQGISKKDIATLIGIPPLLAGIDILLVLIPLHPKREKKRGFNQAELLARVLAQVADNRKIEQVLTRTKATAAQAKLTGVDRSTNISDAFVVAEGKNLLVSGKHIVLVDDVITTGNTMDAASKLLKENGAQSVWALTIAYGHPMHA